MIINDVIFNTDLEDILLELQYELKSNQSSYFQKSFRNSGAYIQVQCPFHGDGQEHKQSAGINRYTGTLHCFACGVVKSLPEVISYCFGYTNDIGVHGWQWLLHNFATVQVEERKPIRLDLNRYNKQATDSKFVTEQELRQYRQAIPHPYWQKRGIVDLDIIKLFDLGYDEKSNSITFPVRNVNGDCLFIARRNVNSKFFSYPKGAEKPLYALFEIKSSKQSTKEIYICESMIDCILLWQAGYTAVALNGLGNDLQFNQLNHLYCREYVLATDNDEAGMRARERIRHNVKNHLFSEIAFPRDIKDIGECSRDQQKNIKNWKFF